MLAGCYGDLQLGADAVRGRNQDGVAVACGLQVEQGPKAPKTRRRAAAGRAGGKRLDRLNKRRPRIDIDAGVTIAAGVYGVLRGDGL